MNPKLYFVIVCGFKNVMNVKNVKYQFSFKNTWIYSLKNMKLDFTI